MIQYSSIEAIWMEGEMADETKLPVTQEAENWRQRIQNWLMEEGWQVGTATVPEAVWVITGEDSHKRHITVAQRQDRPDQIVINGAVDISESHKGNWLAMEQGAKRTFALDLQIALMNIDVEFQATGKSPETPDRFMFAQRIYYDGLTKDAFLQRVSWVRRAVTLFIILIQKEFQPTAPQQQPMGFKID